MKKISTSFILFFFAFTGSHSQTLTDVARSKVITWYGVDYSEARFINFESSLTAGALNDSLISIWSLNPLSDDDQDEIKKRYMKDELEVDLSTSEKRNRSVDFNTRIVNENFDLDIEKIREIISSYKTDASGYGVLVVVEGFEKIKNRGFIWVAFINNADKKIISARRYICDTSLIGTFKGRWLDVIHDAIFFSGKALRAIK